MRKRARQQRVRTPRRSRRAVSLLAAVAAAAALTAVSISSQQFSAATRGAQAPQQSAAKAPAAKGSVVVRDADSGELRDATPEELLELQSQTLQASEVAEPIVSATGFSGLRLGADQMTFTVATRNADGSVGVAHAPGKRAAEKLVRAGEKGGLVAGKEQLLDR